MKTKSLLTLLMLIPLLLPGGAHGYRYVDGFNRYSSALSGSGIPRAGIRALAVQPWDGKVVIGGNFSVNRSDIVQKNLARINTDGTFDSTFTASASDTVNAIAIQPDRLILIGGSFRAVSYGGAGSVAREDRYALARLSSVKGDLDPFTGKLPDGAAVNSIVMHPDGSILIGGAFQKTATAEDPLLCRNLARISAADGSFLNCYSGGVTGGDVNAIALQDGRVVAGGGFTGPRLKLARFLPDGDLDENFLLAPDGTVWALGVQADGKVLLGGDFTAISGTPSFRLARFDSAAALDDQFQPVLDGGVGALAVQPDGRVVVGGAFSARVARLDSRGAADPKVAPVLNGAVHAVALQPDEKFLAAGEFSSANGKTRTMLARFYPYGTLDDDVKAPSYERRLGAWDDDAFVQSASVAPDGKVTVGGHYGWIDGRRRIGLSRLNPDWTVQSEEEFPAPNLSDVTSNMVPRPDGRISLGGIWSYLDEERNLYQPCIIDLNPDGSVENSAFNTNVQQYISRQTWFNSNTHGYYRLPDGTLYVGGYFLGVDGGERYLLKLDKDGLAIPGFNPEVTAAVNAMLWVPDKVKGDKLLAGVEGRLLRLLPSGAPDPSWFVADPTIPAFHWAIDTQEDGKIVSATDNRYMISKDGKTWERQVVRFNNNRADEGIQDGTLDDSFLVGFRDTLGPYPTIRSLRVLADGTILAVGQFNRVTDNSGVEVPRTGVAHLDQNGKLLPLDLGDFKESGDGYRMDLVNTVMVQPDAKLIITGAFFTIDGDPTLKQMIRISLGWWATKDIEVAPDGSSVTWHRGGMGPRLWRVTFEYSPDGSDGSWKALGDGERSGQDWHLRNQDLAAKNGYYRTGYIRAVGYIVLSNTSGDLEMSTRAFHLKPVVKVRAVPVQRQLGSSNGTFQAQYRFLDDSPAPETELYGAASFSTSATVESPVGDYGITSDVRNLFSPLYSFVAEESVLSVLPAGPKQDQTLEFTISNKTYGESDFAPDARVNTGLPLSYSSSDTSVATIVNGKIHIKKVGRTSITVSQGGNGVYNPASLTRDFEVLRAPIEVRADSKARAFRTPNPPLTASYSGFVYNENGSVISGTPLLSTTANLESPVADYPISVDVSGMTAVNYSFVPRDGTLSVVKSCQEIIFPQPGDRTYGDPPFQLTAYSCSGLPITFTTPQNGVAKVAGSMVTITGAGSAVITASQRGTGNLEGAPDVARTLTVHKGRQEITFPALPPRMLGDAPLLLTARASSGLPVSYQSSELSVASISGSSAELVGPGTAVITATQEGSPNYNAAIPVSQPLIVAAEGEPPLLSLSTLATGAVTADPVLNVAGGASDPSGIAGVSVDGVKVADPASLFSSAVALTGGDNRIEVSASDGAGNRASREFIVTFDAAAPFIDISTPADNSVADSAFFTVSGTVSAGSAVTLAVNGAAATPLNAGGGSFTGNGYLREGLNTIVVSAELAGRSSTVKRSVTLAPGRPHAAITEPSRDIRTEKGTLLLRGTAGALGSEVTLQLDVDGTSFTPALQGGTFQQAVTLGEAGEHRITATVTDRSGNSSVARRNVIRMARVPGDLNGDSLVDLRDALAVLRISLGMEPATPQALEHGDVAPLVNGECRPDGRIDVGDVLLVLRKVVGLVQF